MHRPSRAAGVVAALVVSLSAVASCATAAVAPPAATPLAPADTKPALYVRLPQAVKDAGVIRFAGDSHPPYRTVGPDGSITGIDRDFQDGLSRVLGVRIETGIVDGLPAALDGMRDGRPLRRQRRCGALDRSKIATTSLPTRAGPGGW